MLLHGFVLSALALPLAGPLAAQQWNGPAARALAERATVRRDTTQADSSLRSYRTVAHGFVLFIAGVGDGEGITRLSKADELKVEVYWRAPDVSKQVILGWRDGSWLPNDINYHRDHLGIVTNNFGDRIRIGEGDEVRDVVHPLSAAGLDRYDFALGDSLTISNAGRRLRVQELKVRPRAFGQPAVIGTLYLDVATADLVRFRFSFTPASYIDKDLESISIALENSLWEGRYWLPYRQEIEIRRKLRYLDFPVTGIIRGRWEIQDYDLDVEIPPTVLAGPDIGGLQRATPAARAANDSTWGGRTLAQAVEGMGAPVDKQDLAALRLEVERIAQTRALSGLPSSRLAARSVSDLVHVNRVQGLALGFGGTIALGKSRVELRPSIGFGTSDERVTGGLTLQAGAGATRVSLTGERRIRDFSDWPVVAPLLNSITAQEGGRDYGDYVLLNGANAAVRHQLSARSAVTLQAGVEESRSVAVEASPATGSYRPNPALGAGTYGIARLRLDRGGAGLAARSDLQGSLALEGGTGPTDYLRAALDARWQAPLGQTSLLARVQAGAGTDGMPAYRSFAMGGRGTLLGYPHRAFGGRQAALAHLEWRVDVPVPAANLGSFLTTGRTVTLAPFVAAGWTRDPASAELGGITDGIRPTAGVAAELFMRLLRIEAGVGLRDGKFGVTVDLNRDWWPLL